jgi:hypothetical protein
MTPGLAALADERDPPMIEIDLLGAQVHQFLHAEAGVSQRQKEHPAHLSAETGLCAGPLDDDVGFGAGGSDFSEDATDIAVVEPDRRVCDARCVAADDHGATAV